MMCVPKHKAPVNLTFFLNTYNCYSVVMCVGVYMEMDSYHPRKRINAITHELTFSLPQTFTRS